MDNGKTVVELANVARYSLQLQRHCDFRIPTIKADEGTRMTSQLVLHKLRMLCFDL
jgi:hypothetical protein